MPRNVLILIILILIIGGLAAFFSQNYYKAMYAKTALTNQPAQQATTKTSIQDLLNKAGSMTCDYTDDKGKTYKVYIKNGKARSDISSSNAKESGTFLLVDKKIYFWNLAGAYIMDMPDLSGQQTTGTDVSQKDQLIGKLEQYKKYCKTATVADSLFVVPTNIKFQDTAKMMPQYQNPQQP